MNKIKIILPICIIAIIVIGLAIGPFKITDIFSSGDEYYDSAVEAYEAFEDVSVDDDNKISTFDFSNYAFLIHYFDDDIIKLSFIEKDDGKYKYSGDEISIEEQYITKEFRGDEFSHNNDRIECDIVSVDSNLSDEYTTERIKLKNQDALFAYRFLTEE